MPALNCESTNSQYPLVAVLLMSLMLPAGSSVTAQDTTYGRSASVFLSDEEVLPMIRISDSSGL